MDGAEMAADVELRCGAANDRTQRGVDRTSTLLGLGRQDSRPVPHVKAEHPALAQVSSNRVQRGQYVVVGALVAEHGEHEHGRVERAADSDAAQVALAETHARQPASATFLRATSSMPGDRSTPATS